MKPLRVGIIGFDGLNALDLIGPAEAFATARAEEANRSSTNGLRSDGHRVIAAGVSWLNRELFSIRTLLCRSAPKLDTIIIPGGRGLRRPDANRAVATVDQNSGAARRGESCRFAPGSTDWPRVACSMADG